ncbi:MAG: hypothetical protein IH899_17545 [Planctomycetes bacterium]|nr:hypothetical protein [Planctomycetota bacterium]
MWISWKQQHTDFSQPPTLDDKVAIFYEQIWGWQLHIAELCLDGGKDHEGKVDLPKIPHSAFAAMQIMLSYFEMIAKYEDGFIPTGGNHKAGKYFKRGVRSVFPSLANENATSVDDLLSAIWKKARCGLYHMSQTAAGIVLTGEIAEAMQFNTFNKVLVINPHRLPAVLKKHLEDYRRQLLDPANTTLRQKFEDRYNYDNPA